MGEHQEKVTHMAFERKEGWKRDERGRKARLCMRSRKI